MDTNQNITDFFEGKVQTLPQAYTAIHADWENLNPNSYQLNTEEKIESFSQLVGEYVEKTTVALIKEKALEPEEEKKWLRNMRRGHILLASTDPSKTFNTLVTKENIASVDKLNTVYLSAVLPPDQVDPSALLDAQYVKNILSNLKSSHFRIKSIEHDEANRTLKVELDHPDIQAYEFDLSEEETYEKVQRNGDRTKHDISSLLPEELSASSGSEAITPFAGVNVLDEEISKNMSGSNISPATNAALAAISAANAANRANYENNRNNLLARNRQMPLKAQIDNAKLNEISNVMASKANMINRAKQELKNAEESHKRDLERQETYKKEQEEHARKIRINKKKNIGMNAKKNRGKKAAIAGGTIAAAASTAAIGAGTLITEIVVVIT